MAPTKFAVCCTQADLHRRAGIQADSFSDPGLDRHNFGRSQSRSPVWRGTSLTIDRSELTTLNANLDSSALSGATASVIAYNVRGTFDVGVSPSNNLEDSEAIVELKKQVHNRHKYQAKATAVAAALKWPLQSAPVVRPVLKDATLLL